MTTTTQTCSGSMQLAPYVYFYGRCEEALAFYKTVFGGTYELMRNTDTPMVQNVPADFREKIMHASFTAPGVTFMASDGGSAHAVDPDAGNISLALTVSDRAAAERAFTALSEGGEVRMPLGEAFWGGRFGVVHDRFGIEWMLSSP